MAYRINDECINCGICRVDCREEAIIEGAYVHEVVGERCTDCGVCAEICPTAACRPEGIDRTLIWSGIGWDA